MQVLNTMKEANVHPTEDTFSILINAHTCAEETDINRVFKVRNHILF